MKDKLDKNNANVHCIEKILEAFHYIFSETHRSTNDKEKEAVVSNDYLRPEKVWHLKFIKIYKMRIRF